MWSQSGERIPLSGWGRCMPILVKLTLRGHLRHLYEVITDVAPLRALYILRANFPDHCNDLQEMCRGQQVAYDGKMHKDLLKFINGDFRAAIEEMSGRIGWTVEDAACNSVFLDRVARKLEVTEEDLKGNCMSDTPCLNVNDTQPYEICKSNINLVDLFHIFACGGKGVFGLRQKNNCSMALVAPVFANGAEYAFEIGGIFEIDGNCFAYLTNGIVLNMTSMWVKATDNQYRCALFVSSKYNGTFAVTELAIACRFGVSYSFVLEAMKGLTYDHCSIDSGNHAMWNIRAANKTEQNENKSERAFELQTLSQIEGNDSTHADYLRESFQRAKDAGLVRPLLRPDGTRDSWLTHEDLQTCFGTQDIPIAMGEGKYAKMLPWGYHEPVHYYSTEYDTILCKGQLDDIESLQFVSNRHHIANMCTVSDLAAQHRYRRFECDGDKYSLARSIAFSDEYYRNPITTPSGGHWVNVINSSGEELHVDHRNSQPSHNYSANLQIVTQSENNRLGAMNALSRNQVMGARHTSLVIEKRNDRIEVSWHRRRPPNAAKVSSFSHAMKVINNTEDPLAVKVSEWTPFVQEPEYQFQVFRDSPEFLHLRIRCSISKLHYTCIKKKINVPCLDKFQKALLADKPGPKRFKPGTRIERLSDNGDVKCRLFFP